MKGKNHSKSKTKERQTKEFICNLCGWTTDKFHKLVLHTRTHTKEAPFKCTFEDCDFSGIGRVHLISHIKFMHSDSFPFLCDYPDCSFKTKSCGNLKAHERTHTKERPFKCEWAGCSYSAVLKGHLKYHMVTHTQEKKYECPHPGCQFKAGTTSALLTHKLTHSDLTPFACSEEGCDYRGKSKGYLKGHMKRCHSENTENRPFSCELCSHKSKTRPHLKVHMRSHLGESQNGPEKAHACPHPNCSYTTHREDCLKGHIKVVHTDQKNFPCEKCERRCKTRQNLNSHMKTHQQNRPRPFNCSHPSCTFAALARHQLEKHKKTVHATEEQKKFKCSRPDCSYATATEFSLKNHIVAVHTPSSEKSFECAICRKKYASDHLRKVHFSAIHDPKSKKKTCTVPSCSFKCRSRPELTRHMIFIHKAGNCKEFKCPLEDCDYETITRKSLHAHIAVRHTGEKNYPCPISGCSYRGATSTYLSKHQKAVHDESSRVKRFKCPVSSCGYKGANRRIIQYHQVTCHFDEGVRPFKCPHPDCDYAAKHQYTLKSHMRLHNEKERKKCPISSCPFSCVQGGDMKTHMRRHSGEKPYACALCDYRGVTSILLKNHISSKHTKEKGYKCQEDGCGYSTRQSTDLTVHMRRWHTGEKPYKCQEKHCSATFVNNSDMRYHMRTHNRNKIRKEGKMKNTGQLSKTGSKPRSRATFWQCPVPACLFKIKKEQLGKLAAHLTTAHQLPVVQLKRI